MTRLSIPDMSCGHCRASVTDALTKLPSVTGLSLDGEARIADVQGDAPTDALLAALNKIGFPAKTLPL
jgi:copper chaperone